MFPHRFDEQRIFFQRFARMQDFVIFIIIDIRYADNEFEARFFGRRYKSVGQTGRCGVSPQEGAARNGVRARGRLSPFKIYSIDKTFESRIGLSDTPIKLKRTGILGSAAYVRRLPRRMAGLPPTFYVIRYFLENTISMRDTRVP